MDEESYEGKTRALDDGQAVSSLDAPGPETEKGKRDRAILSVLLYHGLRREEVCTLKVRDIRQRREVLHPRVHGKDGKLRYLPCTRDGGAHPRLPRGRGARGGPRRRALPAGEEQHRGRDSRGSDHRRWVYKMVKYYARRVGVDIEGFGAHSLRATAATKALDHEADIAKRCRSGSDTLTSLPRDSTTGRRPGRRTVRHLR
jgi:integrase